MLKIDINKQLHGSNGKMDLDINLEIKQGEFLALAGESGSGKTTLLRILAGLEKAKGDIIFDKTIWQNNNSTLAPQKRAIGFVFQDYALFENMNVEQNLLFVNKDKKLAKHLLEITQLTNLTKRSPSTLSGGQKQRVSLCRAMMNKPKLLLMDEPLSALDPKMRLKLQEEILILHKEFNTTTIMVSHDPNEIKNLADRVILLEHGTIIKDTSPQNLYSQPQTNAKFSFEAKVVELSQVNNQNIITLSIDTQLINILVTDNQMQNIIIGQTLSIDTSNLMPLSIKG